MTSSPSNATSAVSQLLDASRHCRYTHHSHSAKCISNPWHPQLRFRRSTVCKALNPGHARQLQHSHHQYFSAAGVFAWLACRTLCRKGVHRTLPVSYTYKSAAILSSHSNNPRTPHRQTTCVSNAASRKCHEARPRRCMPAKRQAELL